SHWSRDLPDGRQHRYGLPWSMSPEPKIFCANVEFLMSRDSIVLPAERCVVVEIWTPRSIRIDRLLARSPELGSDQVQLAQRSSEMDDQFRKSIDCRVDNRAVGVTEAVRELLKFLDTIAVGNRR